MKQLILFGGSSEERLVSVASAQNLMTHLPQAKLVFLATNGAVHFVSPSELARHTEAFTKQFTPSEPAFAGSLRVALDVLKDHVFIIALHGTEGEDGTLQELLETNGFAFTGAGSKASRLAFDKKHTKEIARTHHLPITEDLLVNEPSSPKGHAALKDFLSTYHKIVLKPVANGSSVGLFILDSQSALDEAITKIRPEAGAYLAERFLIGREITVGVRQKLDGTLSALPCSEVRVIQGRQFDYEGKYLGHGVQELTPAPITPEQTLQCQALAIEVHKATGCEGYSRTDMILTDRGPVVLEINTLPGLSRASFIPQQLTANGETLSAFFKEQIELAERRLKK